MILDNNAHSVFILHYHLILIVKYRRKVLDEPVSARAREIFEYIAPDYKITLEEWRENKFGEVFSTDNVYYWTMAQHGRGVFP